MQKIDNVLVAEEKKKWAQYVGNDVDGLAASYAKEFFYFDPASGHVSKAQWIAEFRKTGPLIQDYALQDFRVARPTADVAIVTCMVTYKARADVAREQALPETMTFTSSTWAKRRGKWETVYYQTTPMPKKGST